MTRRSFLSILALITLVGLWLTPTQAAAQDDAATPCCFALTNNMHCSITFCLETPSGPVCVTVPGGTRVSATLNVNDCTNPALFVTDICGNRRLVPVNGCTIANLGSCCPKICLTRTPDSRCWQITADPSLLCYACEKELG